MTLGQGSSLAPAGHPEGLCAERKDGCTALLAGAWVALPAESCMSHNLAKIGNRRCVCVMSEMCGVSSGSPPLSICCTICPRLLTPAKHLFPFPGKRVRAGSERQRRELDTAKPRTFLGQRKEPDGKRPSEGKPAAPFGQIPTRLSSLIGPEEQATHSSCLASSK